MTDYTKLLPSHIEKYIGENDLFIEIYNLEVKEDRPPLLFVHGAYTGSWMWSKYISHFVEKGYKCFVMNMRGHYKSRSVDMTRVTFDDYLEDIKEVIGLCGRLPIIIGFSMGGILCQKLAEEYSFPGLVVIDTSISREVNNIAPYNQLSDMSDYIVYPAPIRDFDSLDESREGIEFQIKYLSMESAVALGTCSCGFKSTIGISIDAKHIKSPALVIKAVNDEDDDKRGRATAEQLNADYQGFDRTTHTGLLVGIRYKEVVNRILNWLDSL